jgi:hypothetical protein
LNSVLHKIGKSTSLLKEKLDEILFPLLIKLSKSKNFQYNFIYAKSNEFNIKFYDKKLFNLSKNKLFLGNNSTSKIIIYDESDLIDREENFSINFKPTNFQLIKLINDFVQQLIYYEINTLVICNDSVSSISNYQDLFYQNNINVLKLYPESENLNNFETFVEKNSLMSINLFTYRYIFLFNDKNDIFEVLPIYDNINIVQLNSLDNKLENYFYFDNVNNDYTIIIHGINIEQCKIIKGYFLKIIKLFEISKNNNFKFINLKDIISAVEEFILQIKNWEKCRNFTKIIENLFLQYKISFDIFIQKKEGDLFEEDYGKMYLYSIIFLEKYSLITSYIQ